MRQGHERAADVRDVVAAQMPGYRVGSVVLLGEGEDNVAFQVDDELIVRFGKESDAAERALRVRDEARLLGAVADVSPLPVPEPSFTDAEQGCLAYFKLPGLPLIDADPRERSAHVGSIAGVLGEFLAALHAVPVGRMAGLVETDDEPMAVWLEESAQIYATIIETVPPERRPAVEAFLDTPPPDGPRELVFSHNDLGIEHVLIDPVKWAVTGVIDWSDAAITDPARDFGLLYRDLGSAALDRALDVYRHGADLGEIRVRAGFYARCGVLEDMAYGLETGFSVYLDKSLAALEWLFPEDGPH
ncbi:phosphotransferase family protein [Actinomadura sp. WMMA1423]|uniref:phosphotransferase family protein n=1 Tax=Actinomadura sp. WMMA1423 TaxID=2591108 RepID=UPI001146983F|nr:phosphotransferase [Actinomadura sp. WMMA1423]